ncbi:MAG TPA: ferritin-like domain-containing protein [Anaerolineae bacterium]
MERLGTLHDLYVHELRDLYDAEKQVVNALPKMASAAAHTDLKNAFQKHLDQTRNHVDRLERIFNDLGISPMGKECVAMQGLLKEGEKLLQTQADPDVKDAALIGAAQRVEHYEIAGYGTARTYADLLGYDDAADLLQDTLDEEGNTDEKLTKIATGGLFSEGINKEAMARR